MRLNGKLALGLLVCLFLIKYPYYILVQKLTILFRGYCTRWLVTLAFCILTQNESGNKINLHLTTPEEKEYWEIRFNPITLTGVDMSAFFKATTNISGEGGSMADGNRDNKNWIVNQNRYAINVYIANIPKFQMLFFPAW